MSDDELIILAFNAAEEGFDSGDYCESILKTLRHVRDTLDHENRRLRQRVEDSMGVADMVLTWIRTKQFDAEGCHVLLCDMKERTRKVLEQTKEQDDER